MYLTKTNSKHDIGDYKIHQIIKSVFPNKQKVLWQQNNHTLYILSENKPIENIGDFQKININDLIKNDEQHIFSIKMNPVYKDSRTGKKIKIEESKINKWVQNKFFENGIDAKFKINFDGYNSFQKKDKDVPAWTIMVRGFLIVKESEKFKMALINGIGKLKFIGYGMLNIFEY